MTFASIRNILALGLALAPVAAHAVTYPASPMPVALTTATYTQNFNTLASTGTTASTLPAGWQVSEADGTYRISDGSANNGDVYSFGATGAADRALGSLASGTNTPLYFGAFFTNNLAATITGLSFDYIGEQWRGGTATDDQLTFQYSFNATSIDSMTATWSNLSSLNFLSPNVSTAGALDGNLAANRTALVGTLAGLAIGTGSTFAIRWVDQDNTGSDDGLAVDDFRLVATTAAAGAVPEPAAWAMMLAGVGMIGAALRRRRAGPAFA